MLTSYVNGPLSNNICKFISNILTVSYIDYTDLRKSIVYYNLYCIWTNNVFASFIPFLSLLFFNVSIAMELNSKANRKKVSIVSVNIWLHLQTVSTQYTNKQKPNHRVSHRYMLISICDYVNTIKISIVVSILKNTKISFSVY